MMNKNDVTTEVYLRLSEYFDPPLTFEDVSIMVNLFLEVLETELTSKVDSDGSEPKISFRGFGKFTRVVRKGRVYTIGDGKHAAKNRYQIVYKPGSRIKDNYPAIPE